ncbi:DciA family protein [Leptotrichia trevisanii]|uniref:DciA family protein n=1 Tax=Leptotrichia trevisanii TaxID=109328 RepID=UPI0026E9822A|nr:DciA family protein [Leptotrichia trevisanii]
MEGIKDLKNLALEAIEKKSSLLKNEKYILWKIKKNWKQIINGPIGEKTYPKSLFNGNLAVVINDGIIYHTTIMYAENIKDKINTFLNGKFLESIEFVKVNYKIKRDLLDELIENEEKRGTIQVEEIPRGNIGEKSENAGSENKITEKVKDIVLSAQEIKEIHENIDKIDKKYEDIARRLEKIAINLKKREKYLKNNGYIECENCKILFLQENKEKVCFECRMNEKNRKFQKMADLIRNKPYISEKQAVRITNTDKATYYKARDILAQQTYNDMLYYCLEKNREISLSEDYEFEIRSESREDVEKFIKNYVDYKIGSDNEEVFKVERKWALRRLRKDMKFRLENNRRY